jgi:hypothetical protein
MVKYLHWDISPVSKVGGRDASSDVGETDVKLEALGRSLPASRQKPFRQEVSGCVDLSFGLIPI